MANNKQIRKRLTMWFILITVMLDAAGFGIIMPVLPNLIEEVSSTGISDAARIGGYLIFAFGITQFLFGPIIGNLSDAFGRRPILLYSLFGMVIDYIIMALAPTIGWLLFGRLLGGVTSATHATANAVITDITNEDERAIYFGRIGAAFGVGFILGPVIGGTLSLISIRAPFWGAAVIAALNMAFGMWAFRESLLKSDRRKFEWRRSNPVGSFLQLRKQPKLWALAIIFFFYNLAFAVYPSIWSFFTQFRFGFEPWMVGVTLFIFGVSFALAQGLLVKPAVRKFGARTIVKYGLFFEALIFLAVAFTMHPWLLLVVLPLSALASIVGPAYQDIATRLVSKTEQGELQGVLAAILSLTGLVGTLMMTQSFAYFTDETREWTFSGAPFVLSALSSLVAWLIYYFYVNKDGVQEQLDASSDR